MLHENFLLQIHVASRGRGIDETGGSSAGVAPGHTPAHVASTENEARELREIVHSHVVRRSKEQKPPKAAEPGTPYRFPANDAERYASLGLTLDASVHR